jgi:hypothetical protein
MDYGNNINIIKERYQQYGLTRILKVIARFVFFDFPLYIARRLEGNNSFYFNNVSYEYHYGLYNETWLNERCVEIPLAIGILTKFKDKRILEIGNVLSHYIDTKHDVVDKYEIKNGVINKDVIDYNPLYKYDLILSISTLEHVGFDEEHQDQEKINQAIEKLKSILNIGGILFITVALGYNPHLDFRIRKDILGLEQYYLKRISKGNKWKQVSFDEVNSVKYGNPFKAANAIMIGIFYNK